MYVLDSIAFGSRMTEVCCLLGIKLSEFFCHPGARLNAAAIGSIKLANARNERET